MVTCEKVVARHQHGFSGGHMHYVVMLGISVIGYGDQRDTIMLAQQVSEAHPLRLVRIIDTHTDEIVWTYRNGEAQFHG